MTHFFPHSPAPNGSRKGSSLRIRSGSLARFTVIGSNPLRPRAYRTRNEWRWRARRGGRIKSNTASPSLSQTMASPSIRHERSSPVTGAPLEQFAMTGRKPRPGR
jgi:hypothetical protein